jgi:2-haloacid dehalogenase
MVKPAAIVFDVNETLLDMSALDPLFADAFSDKAVRRVWFAQTIANALTATLVGTYADFGEMQRAALEMTAKRRGVAIDPERVRRILHGVATLPAHGDVHAGLTRLRGAGIRLAVLTNSTASAVEEQLENARLRTYFEAVSSADSVRRFKPAPEPYAMAAETLGLPPAEILFAAAHDWDVTGAMKAGYRTAFIARHGMSLNPLEAPPETIAPDIRALADAIVGAEIPA